MDYSDCLGMYIFSLDSIKIISTENYPETYLTKELDTGEKEPNANASLDKTIPRA